MIRKIIVSTFFVLLLLAISLYLAGVRHVELGTTFMAFLRKCSRELETVRFSIPDIPSIPELSSVEGFEVVLDVLIKFVNGLVNILNFIVMILNTIIQLLQFAFILIKNFLWARDKIISQS